MDIAITSIVDIDVGVERFGGRLRRRFGGLDFLVT